MTDNLSQADRRRAMQAVRSTDTTPERIVRKALHALGCRFRLHRDDLPGKPDIVLPSRRLAIFVHGCFWHQHRCTRGRRTPATNTTYWQRKLQRNVQRDRLNRRQLNNRGWRVLTIWECWTKPSRRDWLIEKLRHAVNP